MNKKEEEVGGKMELAESPRCPSSAPWQLERPKWSQQNRYLLENQTWTDCVFVVGGEGPKRFECHKLLLGKASAVFGAMLFGDLAKEEDEEIQIVDVEPDTFQVLLEYVYTESVDLETHDALVPDLCRAANKYLLPPLEALCFEHLAATLTPATACRAFDLADLLECASLRQAARKMMERRTDEVLSAESFLAASPAVVQLICEQEELHLRSEVPLVGACFAWAECQGGGLREVLGPLLASLRFLTLSQTEFVEGPANTKPHLTADEKLKLLSKIICPNGSSEIPKGFSDITKGRIFLDVSLPNVVFSGVLNVNYGNVCNYCARPASEGNFASACFTADRDVCLQGVVVSNSAGAWKVVLQDSRDAFCDVGVLTMTVAVMETRVEFSKHVVVPRDEKFRVTIINVQRAACTAAVGVAVKGENVFSDPSVAPNSSISHLRGVIYVKI